MTRPLKWRAGLALSVALVFLATACTDNPPNAGAGVGATRTRTTFGPTGTATPQPTTSSGGTDTQPPQPGVAVTVTAIPGGTALTPGETIADNLDVPWGIGFLPNGDAVVSERDTGRLLRLANDGSVRILATVAGVTPTSEGGLLGVAVSPDYHADKTIFVYATTAEDNRVLSGTIADFRAGIVTAVLTGIPRAEIHDGGRLAFGPDGMLYVTTGETGDAALAQNLDSLGGKILRIHPDGTTPADNPFAGSPVWSYGHRNVQGLAWDDSGRLWASEFGSESWDEINLIQPGKNYGWPAAEGTADLAGMTDPAAVFTTDSASPSGLAYADGALWMAALQGRTTWRVPVTSAGLSQPQAVRIADARTRTVVVAPDGRIWATTSNTDGRGTPGRGDDKIIAISQRDF